MVFQKGFHSKTEFKKGQKNPIYGKHPIPWNKGKKTGITWNKGKKCPQISEARRGRAAWNKGKKGCFSESTLIKMSDAKKDYIPWIKGKKGIHCSPITEFKKGHKMSEVTIRKMSASRMGFIPWNKGLKGWNSGEKHPLYGHTGERAPNWKGGISFLPYSLEFSKELKEKIRERDNRTCQLCGVRENGKKLPVHHVHYDKANCAPDLISLCHRCNSKVNFNRDHYENLFMEKLKLRGLC